MKTVTKNISLSEDLANFAMQEAEEGGDGSVSAYFAGSLRMAGLTLSLSSAILPV